MEMNRDYTVLMGVQNGANWLHDVLRSVQSQDHAPTSILLYDNASTDATVSIASEFPEVTIIHGSENIGVWAAIESMLPRVTTPYVLCLTDVVLSPSHVRHLVECMQHDESLGAVQGMLLNPNTNLVDCYGFHIAPSRAVSILGHGETPSQHTAPFEVFAVEGAAPFFRMSALASITIDGSVVDRAYRIGPLGYGDDLDIAWRLHVVGWKQYCAPQAVGYHVRSTTTSRAQSLLDRIRRRAVRAKIPLIKRQLDWCNVRFTILKNDAIVNLLRYLPSILTREILVQ
jgi:GT2 family glycosyltransferase